MAPWSHVIPGRASRALLWLAVGTTLLFGGPVCAQSLQVSPVLIDLQPGQRTATLLVTNKGDQSAILQLRPFHWAQEGNVDKLTPTQDVAVSPPIGTIGPNDTQTFRVVLRRPPANGEEGYRLLLDQLPPPGAPGVVTVALRFSIPLFAKPANIAAGQVNWQISLNGGKAELVGTNVGQRHVRVINATLTLAGGEKLAVAAGQGPYVLPGQRRSWPITGAAQLRPGATCRLTAFSDAGPVDATVDVSGP